jgi:hypothetical protein
MTNNIIINTGAPARNLVDVLHEVCLLYDGLRTEDLSYHEVTEWVKELELEIATLLKKGV